MLPTRIDHWTLRADRLGVGVATFLLWSPFSFRMEEPSTVHTPAPCTKLPFPKSFVTPGKSTDVRHPPSVPHCLAGHTYVLKCDRLSQPCPRRETRTPGPGW